MTTPHEDKNPTAIELHQKSHILSIDFADGAHFDLPCEYLRVFSKAAEVRTMTHPEVGKEDVNITRIEPQGQYAVRLYFSDGHDTGIYSWETLYDLGMNQQRNWQGYLERLAAAGYQRSGAETPGPAAGATRVRLLYFAHLPRIFGREAEEVALPASVRDVSGLLQWLARREKDWAPNLAEDKVRVTVNKQFAEMFTRLDEGDEVAIVPNSPRPV